MNRPDILCHIVWSTELENKKSNDTWMVVQLFYDQLQGLLSVEWKMEMIVNMNKGEIRGLF
jgi:hypothetical protein